jgi:creatinine amidohydrolase/Fe(II)-dependent formamide hydrolase-like protein
VVETGAPANGHAAETGTSNMLHLAPKLVVRERIANATPSAAPSAYPVPATAEKGAEMIRRGVARIVAFTREEME